MEPANPPLPTPWNLPFQPEAGSQTSSLISESLDGFSTSETRQNAAVTSIGRLSGGVNEPAATDCALEMAALGNATLARSSHVAAKAGKAEITISTMRIICVMIASIPFWNPDRDEQRPLASVSLQSRQNVRPIRFDEEHACGNAFLFEDLLQVICRRLFVSRRVRRIEAQQRLVMPHGLLVECGPVRLLRLSRGGATEREKGTQSQR